MLSRTVETSNLDYLHDSDDRHNMLVSVILPLFAAVTVGYNASDTSSWAPEANLALQLLLRIVYVLYFHPLATYPGPLLARLTDIYYAYYAWKGDIHLKIYEDHQKYGKTVPENVSILFLSNYLASFTNRRLSSIRSKLGSRVFSIWAP